LKERQNSPDAANAASCWDGLTFETKDEIIIFIERIAILLAELTPLAFFRIDSSFIIESCLLHIPTLEGGQL
jgi:hypothetical protein